jgi:hypothetical protein
MLGLLTTGDVSYNYFFTKKNSQCTSAKFSLISSTFLDKIQDINYPSYKALCNKCSKKRAEF